jgi:hypothetical protein
MKQFLLFSAMLCVFFFDTRAQEMEFGLKGGLNIGTPIGVAEKGATGKLGVGPLLGMYFAYDLGGKWSVHGEFLYSYKGSKFHTPVSGDTIYKYNTITLTDTIPSEANTMYRGWVDGKFDNRYLDMPLFVSYQLSSRFLMMFGGYVSYLIEGNNTGTADIEVGDPKHPFTTVTDEPFDQSSELNQWDYGLMLGTTYITERKINFGISLSSGMRSIYRKNYKYIDGVVRNLYMQTFVQFRIAKNNK